MFSFNRRPSLIRENSFLLNALNHLDRKALILDYLHFLVIFLVSSCLKWFREKLSGGRVTCSHTWSILMYDWLWCPVIVISGRKPLSRRCTKRQMNHPRALHRQSRTWWIKSKVGKLLTTNLCRKNAVPLKLMSDIRASWCNNITFDHMGVTYEPLQILTRHIL